jgi:hypothetical protein
VVSSFPAGGAKGPKKLASNIQSTINIHQYPSINHQSIIDQGLNSWFSSVPSGCSCGW